MTAAAPAPSGVRARWTRLAICVALGFGVASTSVPDGVEPAGWRVLAIFAAVIAAFVLQPLPMASVVILALLATVACGALEFDEALAGYGESVVWLVVGAFLLAGGVRDTGLGRRIALTLLAKLGRTTLGLAYAQCVAELVLGTVVPSNTARGGGILAPIVRAMAGALDSEPDRSPERAGAFLVLVGAHANLIAAAMFLTGMAGNAVLADFAAEIYGVEFRWARWALAMLVPGLAAMALLPLLLHRLLAPTVRDARAARDVARAQLAALGPWSVRERVMAGTLLAALALWATGELHGLGTAYVAWVGIGALLVSGAQPWERMAREHGAWDALIWLGGLVTLAKALLELGVIAWFVGSAEARFAIGDPLVLVLVLALVYFYSMYGFSMLTGHILAMAGAFLAVCAAAGAPALLAVPLFAAFSNLCGCTTNYSSGPIVIYYGLGYVPAGRWFRVGFAVSLFHLVVWIPLGLLWWRALGWW